MPQPILLDDAIRIQEQRLPMPSKWQKFIPGLTRRFQMMIWGPKSSRKSTMALDFAKDLSRFGPVLYIMTEERPSGDALKKRARHVRMGKEPVYAHTVFEFDEIEQSILAGRDGKPYEFVVIDSVTVLGRTQPFTDLGKKMRDDVSFIFIYQTNQDIRVPKDGAGMMFFVDIEIHAHNGLARTEKNRLGEYPKEMRIQ